MILRKMKVFTKLLYWQSIIHFEHSNGLFLKVSFVNRKRFIFFKKFFISDHYIQLLEYARLVDFIYSMINFSTVKHPYKRARLNAFIMLRFILIFMYLFFLCRRLLTNQLIIASPEVKSPLKLYYRGENAPSKMPPNEFLYPQRSDCKE